MAFLERAEAAFAERIAVVDGRATLTYRELGARVRGLASGLGARGVEPGTVVSVLAPNVAVALEATLAVPAAGAVLNTLNTRLSPPELAAIVAHAGTRLLVAHHELAATAREVANRVEQPVEVVVAGGPHDAYEELVATRPRPLPPPDDEGALFSINYTSGTTGRPKGVMYSHRGVALQAAAMVGTVGLDVASRFLWTLPLFHCNGWCFPWAVTAAGGTHVMLPRVQADLVWEGIHDHGVTHLNAAPTVLIDLAGSEAAAPVPGGLHVATGGAPPSPALLARLAELNIHVTHLYGLTETYGPAVVCHWWPEWDALPPREQARLRARQGIPNLWGAPLRIVDRDTGRDLPADGASVGEVLVGGHAVMVGYYRDPEATAEALEGGWLRTGDVGVLHPDGYVELRDRAKDVIISGGENIASVEVEQVLAEHPAVLESAVVAGPHPRWGEVVVAFVTLRPGQRATAEELIAHARLSLAGYKVPKRIEFAPLPRTATGKVQKHRLRERLRAEAAPAGDGGDGHG